MPGIPSWSFLNTFNAASLKRRSAARWPVVDDWLQCASKLLETLVERRAQLLARWDQRLGRDPTWTSWARFRPLRLSREEDWSDWLAHLLEADPDGQLAQGIFGRFGWNLEAYHPVQVEREERAIDGSRRADLIIRWSSGSSITHVEVKIGDTQYEKTAETGEKLRVKLSATHCHNVLLVVAEALLPVGLLQDVVVLNWRDVAVALRRSAGHCVDATWRVWAAALSGAVEQRLLGFPCANSDQRLGVRQIDLLAAQVQFLEETLDGG